MSVSQPNFAALNRRRHLYSAGRPSRWALADILVYICYSNIIWIFFELLMQLHRYSYVVTSVDTVLRDDVVVDDVRQVSEALICEGG